MMRPCNPPLNIWPRTSVRITDTGSKHSLFSFCVTITLDFTVKSCPPHNIELCFREISAIVVVFQTYEKRRLCKCTYIYINI